MIGHFGIFCLPGLVQMFIARCTSRAVRRILPARGLFDVDLTMKYVCYFDLDTWLVLRVQGTRPNADEATTRGHDA